MARYLGTCCEMLGYDLVGELAGVFMVYSRPNDGEALFARARRLGEELVLAVREKRKYPKLGLHAAQHRFVSRWHCHAPLRLTALQRITSHNLVVSPLLQRDGVIATGGKRTPASADRPLPQKRGRLRLPVGIERWRIDSTATSRPQKLIEVLGCRSPRWGGRWAGVCSIAQPRLV
ncbi:MAG: hypothetical protein NTW26_11590 [bacterium]|nr:hypothetical protein [bacterium]